MKKLILFELIILFLATTFESDSPPGWFQQTIPVNKIINDIFFTDSSNGWAVTTGGSSSTDTAFILNTTNGGTNWLIQKTGIELLDAVQFLDNNTGYAAGKLFTTIFLAIYKTTNSGTNWTALNNISGLGPVDLYFVNKDTGWICASEFSTGGLYKTTNGGLNWLQQLSASFRTSKLFFINKDTGWAACQNTNLYRTTNGGGVWNLQYTAPATIINLFFPSKDTGFIVGNFGGHTIKRTTDGGFTWNSTSNSQGGNGLFFINSKYGVNSAVFSIVQKTTDGGLTWYDQTVPNGNYFTIQFTDTLTGWSGGSKLIHTTDGGGPVGVVHISTETPKDYILYQNYPNPFNPVTNIKYAVKRQTSNVKLVIFDIQGKQITTLVNEEQRAGTYEADWNASGYSSGVYFYSLIIEGKIIDTKRMILIK